MERMPFFVSSSASDCDQRNNARFFFFKLGAMDTFSTMDGDLLGDCEFFFISLVCDRLSECDRRNSVPPFYIYIRKNVGHSFTYAYLLHMHWVQWIPVMQWWPIFHLVDWVLTQWRKPIAFLRFHAAKWYPLFSAYGDLQCNGESFSIQCNGHWCNAQNRFSFCYWLSHCNSDGFFVFSFGAMETMEPFSR